MIRTALAVAAKDLTLLCRDPQAVFFTCIFPLAFGLFFGAIFESATSGAASIRVGLVTQTPDPRTQTIANSLSADPALTVVHFTSTARATRAIHDGSIPVAVVLTPHSTDGGGDTPDSTGPTQTPSASIITAPGAQLHQSIVEGLLTKHAATERIESIAENFPAGGPITERFTQSPITIQRRPLDARENRPSNIYDIAFAQSMAWALMACAASFAVSMVEERDSGVLVRLRTAHAGLWPVLAGKGAAVTLVSVCLCAAFAAVAWMWFGVSPTQPFTLAAGVAGASLCFAGITMLLAVIVRGRSSPGQLAWGVLLAAAVTGGAMLPLAFMPAWMESISVLSPVRWAILAIEAGVWRDLSGLETLRAAAVLIVTGGACFAAGGCVLAAERRLV